MRTMCGIAGIFDLTGHAHLDQPALERMVDALGMRGPDDQGTSVRPPVAIGMRRLSIIDVETGHQPLANEDGTVEVVANGELYNYVELREELVTLGHRFSTASDTEVLVHGYESWGLEGLLARLEGMFAFALHDVRRAALHLVRDRLGIKPLFYAERAGTVYFASTIPALMASDAIPLEPDLSAVRLYLRWQFTPGIATVVAGVRRVPAGTFVSVASDRVQEPQRYWPLPAPDVDHRSVAEWERLLQELTEDVVAKHMRSDVEVGVLLSGGLDSSIVLALMAVHSERPIKAFTAGVSALDETEHAQKAAARFGATLHRTEFGADAFAASARAAVEQLTEPVGDPACVPLFDVARLARRHVKVVLSGEGADELFSGYGYYSRIASWSGRMVDGCRRISGDGRRAPSGFPYAMPASLVSALTPSLPAARSLDNPADAPGPRDPDAINRACRADIAGFLENDLLPKVDSTSMAHGLEARVPFLDHRMVETALRIPGRLKRRGRTGKLVLRSAFQRLIGTELSGRQKHGFSLPLADWFRGPLRPLLGEVMDDLEGMPWLHHATVKRLIDEHQAGADHARALWNVYTLAAWHRALSRRPVSPATRA